MHSAKVSQSRKKEVLHMPWWYAKMKVLVQTEPLNMLKWVCLFHYMGKGFGKF